MSTISGRPVRVAIVGSGPSGFYAADALIKADQDVAIDMYDRLPTPFGLVRGGVAPDHPKIKNVIRVYERTAKNDAFSFLGNVQVGRDVSVAELRAHYDAVLFTCGAETDRTLDIPGIELPGSYTATEFVGWYNGHPDYLGRSFDLSQEIAVVIGQGNVAVDVTRVLAKTVDELQDTDIAAHALDALAESKVKEVHMIGRRGPVQAAFTNKEIRELGELADCDLVFNNLGDFELNPASQAELDDRANIGAGRNWKVLDELRVLQPAGKSRRIVVHFFQSPRELAGNGKVESLVLERNRLAGDAGDQWAEGTGQTDTVDCGLFFRSVGYRGVEIPGVPFEARRGVFPNAAGRIVDDGAPVPGPVRRRLDQARSFRRDRHQQARQRGDSEEAAGGSAGAARLRDSAQRRRSAANCWRPATSVWSAMPTGRRSTPPRWRAASRTANPARNSPPYRTCSPSWNDPPPGAVVIFRRSR